jgi:predicted transcriptional regulator
VLFRSVADAMHTELPTVGKSSSLEKAFRLLHEKSVPAVAIVDADNRLVGLVTAETIGCSCCIRRRLAGPAWDLGDHPAGAPKWAC